MDIIIPFGSMNSEGLFWNDYGWVSMPDLFPEESPNPVLKPVLVLFKDFKLKHVLIPATGATAVVSYNNYNLTQRLYSSDFFMLTHEMAHIIEPKEGEEHVWNTGKIVLNRSNLDNKYIQYKALKRELECYLIQKQMYTVLKLEDINSRLDRFYSTLKKEFQEYFTPKDFDIFVKQLDFRSYKDIVRIFNERI